MINLFNKKVHESLSLQAKDVIKLSPLIAKDILNGISCDKLPEGKGVFGSITSPIPVNGTLGEIKYLGKLRGKTGKALFFHRIGSFQSQACKNPVDCYEVVCLDGSQWNNLYFDEYHPRRSNIAPPGYSLIPLNKKLKYDIPIGFGIDQFLQNFPYDIPEAIIDFYGSKAFARIAKESLATYNFSKEKIHQEKTDKSTFIPNETKKLNPAFDFVKKNYNIDCNIYRKLAQIIYHHANSAAEKFAVLLKRKTNSELIHFFYDYFLVLILGHEKKFFPTDNNAFSAILEGIHIEYFGNVNQDITDSVLKLYTVKEFCFLKTIMIHMKKQDMRMISSIATYCLIKPDLLGATETLYMAKYFIKIVEDDLEIIKNEFEKLLIK